MDSDKKKPSSWSYLCESAFIRGLIVFATGLLLRLALIAINPIIFGGDTILRLSDRFTLVKGHQLPLLQALIAAVSYVSMDPIYVRYLMAVIGAAAGVGFYWLVADLFGARIGFAAGLLFATNPFITAVSTVPFQEILMLGALFFVFHFFYTERWLAASAFLAVACLTRHEAWAAAPVFVGTFVICKDRSLLGLVKAALLFGWAPAAWMIVNRGMSPGVSFVLDHHISIWRLQRYLYIGWISAKFTQLTVLALAAAGAWRLWTKRTTFDWRLRMQAAFLALFCIALLFSAHGVLPDPERYVTAREAFIPIGFVLLLAAVGLAQWPRWMVPLVASSVLLGAVGAWWYMRAETLSPDTQLTYRVGRYLAAAMREPERAMILARPMTDELSLYFHKVRELEGEGAERTARDQFQRNRPEEFQLQRVRVYSGLPAERFLEPGAACPEWVAVWSDYPDAAREVGDLPPVQVVRAGHASVTIVRRRCPN